MDSTAIKTLLETGAAHAAPLINGAVMQPTDWGFVSTEKFQSAPSRHRRAFTTTRLGDFIAYAKKEEQYDTRVFIAPDVLSVSAIINHGTKTSPDWGDHTARLDLVREPEFAALFALAQGQPVAQQALIDYLEDWLPQDQISALDAEGSRIDPAKAIVAVRKITIQAKGTTTHERADMRSSRSAMEEVEATGATEKLPAFIGFYGVVFAGTEPRHVRARLAVRTSGDAPAFTLRLMSMDVLMRDLATEIEASIKDSLPGVSVHVGNSKFAG